jgi:hypothetical protein
MTGLLSLLLYCMQVHGLICSEILLRMEQWLLVHRHLM